jgi:acetyl-CoA/propionyl-CoA carboxylase biotin carboxyl carrier protein
VLVANRGEIALRVMRTLRALGIRPIAVHSDADVDAPHVRAADLAVRVGPAAVRQSYLDIPAIIDAALSSEAEAIHPGYGFLSENAEFSAACSAAGLVLIGPPEPAMTAMADKIAAKLTVAAAGVSVVPGTDRGGLTDPELVEIVNAEIGYPALIKPSAGGGGKGMRLVTSASELPEALASARREAASAFGDDTLLVERFIAAPRHVEIQVLADAHGSVVHLGERECSLQRRHQKIIEEAPATFLPAHVRRAMAEQAVAAARSCGYVNAGTVEFIVSGEDPEQFFFMEMNTRLQVEHPVTEMIHGVDLVAEQVRIAGGARIEVEQSDLHPTGHSIEARIYAEDPANGFFPTGGEVTTVAWPTGPGVRVDAGIHHGSVITSDYDPMLAKVIVHGHDRAEALHRLAEALADTDVVGVTTNSGFLRRLALHPDVREGRLDTDLVNRELSGLIAPLPLAGLAAVVASMGSVSDDPWSALAGWRHGAPSAVRHLLDVEGRRVDVSVAPLHDGRIRVVVDDDIVDLAANETTAWSVTSIGPRRWWLSGFGWGWSVSLAEPSRGGRGSGAAGAGDGSIRSPMPGTVLLVDVAVGDVVAGGQRLCVVEAMKMEHALVAPFDGIVESVTVSPGTSVALGADLVRIVETPSVSDSLGGGEQ